MKRRRVGSARTVHGADGRVWSLRRVAAERTPHSPDEWEHDVDGGGTPFILGALVVFWVVIVYLFVRGRPHVPWYFWIVPVAFVVFVVLWHRFSHPWTILAETTNPEEVWSGVVRGRGHAREVMRVAERYLRTRGNPGGADSVMQPVYVPPPASSTSILNWPKPPEPK